MSTKAGQKTAEAAAGPVAKRSALAFRPPKPSPFVLGCSRLLVPLILRRRYGVVSVVYRDEDLERFRDLSRDRVVITPNHPTAIEPVVMFHLSRRAGMPFHYVAARETFDACWGLIGALLQRCGVYSIVRGAPDRDSFRMTRKLLSEPATKLVIFPEGEVYSQNDSLLPFHNGTFQLMFFAMEDMRKAGTDAPLFIQPVAMKYRFVQDMSNEVTSSIGRLERALGLRRPAPSDAYARLRRVGDAVLRSAERVYGLEAGERDYMNPRIEAVREAILAEVAGRLGVKPEALGRTLPDKMRALFQKVNSLTRPDLVPETVYEVRLLSEMRDHIRPLLHDLNRLSNWVAVRDGYIAENPTPERVIETLRRLEIEVLGDSRIKGKKRCFVRLGEPFDLREYRDQYSQDKRAAVQAATSRTEDAVQSLLDDMG
ncbi:MAG: 1-acyl-sn-glycerol-3-phosphate acyltransferase [Armatimonadetes bacterium]|nr:1-acyl-sn-glycerol-3-phosphate acyltransferase [Armatimonadota bacterium]